MRDDYSGKVRARLEQAAARESEEDRKVEKRKAKKTCGSVVKVFTCCFLSTLTGPNYGRRTALDNYTSSD